jgi:HJR/Mrr/RecB family endonuclease
VQEVYAGTRHHRCVEACVVAPAGYTRGAIALARSTGVSLYDADTLRQ